MIAARSPSRSRRLALLTSAALLSFAMGAVAADGAPSPKLDAPKAKIKVPKTEKKETEKRSRRKKLTFDDFDLVVKRNIFDPDRKKYVPATKSGPKPPPPPPPPPQNSIVLKGTMKIDRVQFASFDSSLSDYRGRFDRDSDLGEFKLTEVTATNATLKLSTNKFTLRVGESLSRTGEKPWTAAGKSSFSSGAGFVASKSTNSSAGSTSSSGSTSSAAPAPTGKAKMSLIERMKARRAKAAAEKK
jgi:hypothetical protein